MPRLHANLPAIVSDHDFEIKSRKGKTLVSGQTLAGVFLFLENRMALSKLTILKRRWQKLTGSPLPAEIEGLPIADIQRKLDLASLGAVLVVPVERVIDWDAAEDSLSEWDARGEV